MEWFRICIVMCSAPSRNSSSGAIHTQPGLCSLNIRDKFMDFKRTYTPKEFRRICTFRDLETVRHAWVEVYIKATGEFSVCMQVCMYACMYAWDRKLSSRGCVRLLTKNVQYLNDNAMFWNLWGRVLLEAPDIYTCLSKISKNVINN